MLLYSERLGVVRLGFASLERGDAVVGRGGGWSEVVRYLLGVGEYSVCWDCWSYSICF